MSLWSMEEVRSLEDHHGGGNRVAQETYLAEVRDNERPKEGGVPWEGLRVGQVGDLRLFIEFMEFIHLKWLTSPVQMVVHVWVFVGVESHLWGGGDASVPSGSENLVAAR